MATRRFACRLAHSSRHFSAMTSQRRPIDNMTIFGAGLMGSGIAQVAATHGINVTLADLNDEACQNGLSIIKKSLSRVAKKTHVDSESSQQSMIEDVMSRLTTSTDRREAVAKADLVVEAIVEKLSVKRELFKALDEVSPRHTIFASNTSSLKIQDIAESTSTERQKLFAGLHFFNPVPQMKLVEIIQTTNTDDDVIQSLTDLVKKMKKAPANCKDTPGFIVNRLLVPYLFSAMRMAERGEASAQDIDTAMKFGAGYPMGPFELADYVGLDTCLHITNGWREQRVETGEIDAAEVKSVKSLEKLVEAGKLGRKSGEGFYKY